MRIHFADFGHPLLDFASAEREGELLRQKTEQWLAVLPPHASFKAFRSVDLEAAGQECDLLIVGGAVTSVHRHPPILLESLANLVHRRDLPMLLVCASFQAYGVSQGCRLRTLAGRPRSFHYPKVSLPSESGAVRLEAVVPFSHELTLGNWHYQQLEDLPKGWLTLNSSALCKNQLAKKLWSHAPKYGTQSHPEYGFDGIHLLS